MVGLAAGAGGGARADAPQFERVTWYKEPHLRKLYLLTIFLLVASATTGYDGMMVNTSQQMDNWKNYFPEQADPNKLGILINMYNIGSIVSFFIVPYMADILGRKPTIMIGCVIMIGGAMISAFCNGYNSKFIPWDSLFSGNQYIDYFTFSVHCWSFRPRFRQLARSDVLSHASD
jgi:MFS family permease